MKISFDRRRFLKAAGLGVAGAMFPGCLEQLQQAGGGGDKPNILFIMLDDLGPEWVSCYGAEDIETPNADKLALEGMRFLNAYSMPKCTPTRATLMTGQYPFRHGWVN
ncbi:MAG: sulfatase-like hydrolase/transferase, partial [Planctomycetes bacterium]|nr:sulfatase-like hydrolase/transferase [Planctomycetota bacterium]